MSACHFRWSSCWRVLTWIGLVMLLWLVWPQQAFAGSCNGGLIPDIGACIDAKAYESWKGAAVGAWNLNKALLIATYQVNQFRWWVIESLFQSAYTAIYDVVGPLMQPIAILTLTIGLLTLIATPALGRNLRIVNLRQIILLMAFGPVVLVQVGPWIVDLERARSDIVGSVFGDVTNTVPQRLFGAAATDTDMPPVTPLYQSASCGGQRLSRGGTAARTLADGAAALLWATATDIHCPQEAGTEHPELPARWTEPAPSGADFAYNGDLGDVSDAQVRTTYIARIQDGFWRAIYAVIPSLLGLLEELIQGTFMFSTVVLALGLPIMWLYSYFQQTYAGLTRLVTGAAQVIKVSVVTSFLMSLVATALITSATLRNAMTYIASAGIGTVILICVALVAWRTLRNSIETASSSIETATGYSPTQPFALAGQGMQLIASAATAALTSGGSALLTTPAPTQDTFARPEALAEAMRTEPAAAEATAYTPVWFYPALPPIEHRDLAAAPPQTSDDGVVDAEWAVVEDTPVLSAQGGNRMLNGSVAPASPGDDSGAPLLALPPAGGTTAVDDASYVDDTPPLPADAASDSHASIAGQEAGGNVADQGNGAHAAELTAAAAEISSSAGDISAAAAELSNAAQALQAGVAAAPSSSTSTGAPSEAAAPDAAASTSTNAVPETAASTAAASSSDEPAAPASQPAESHQTEPAETEEQAS